MKAVYSTRIDDRKARRCDNDTNVQKKIDTKFTTELLEKDTLRIYERSKDSELIKQKQLY